MSTFLSNKIWIYTLFKPISDEGVAYDDNLALRHFTLDCDVYPCVSKTDEPEDLMLTSLWDMLNPIITGRFLCGWEIYDQIWPRLINRSLHHGIPIPPWAINDLAKKYTTINLIDIANIYKQGVYQGIRPLPPLHVAVKLWTGVDAIAESTLATLNSKEEIEQNACAYLGALQATAARYFNEPLERTITDFKGDQHGEIEF